MAEPDLLPTDRVMPLELAVDEVLAERWRVMRVLGWGPHGVVHLVRDLSADRAAAVKLLRTASKDDAPFAARFERECRELQHLEHPRLNPFYGFGWRGRVPFVAVQYTESQPLDAWLQEQSRASPQEILAIAKQLCEAVSFVHQNALVHRAIKPKNLCLDDQGHLTLLDLGTARDLSKPALEQVDFAGDARYLAPEQLMAQPVDHRADLYAVGVILFELAVGRTPFVSAETKALIKQQLTVPPPNAAVLFPDIPQPVSQVFARALAKSPNARFGSADELYLELERAYRGETAPAVAPAQAQASMQVGRYRLIRKIATGGMAEVFLASAEAVMGFEKRVALKRILPNLADDPKFVERFLKEAHFVARLNHPNIAQIFDAGQADGTYFIAMEFVDGPNLRALANFLIKRGKPSVPLCCRIIASAADGLAFAHSFRDPESGEASGVIHRDISPENILLGANGAVKVVDFGIAKAIDSKTRSTSLRGKYAYMAPEQIQWQRADPRTDIFALAVVLYELLTGKKPYEGATEIAALRAIVDDPAISIRQRRPDVPEEVDRILLRALEKDPDRRFQTAADFSASLQQYLTRSNNLVGIAELAKVIEDYQVGPGTASLIADPELLQGLKDVPSEPARSPPPVSADTVAATPSARAEAETSPSAPVVEPARRSGEFKPPLAGRVRTGERPAIRRGESKPPVGPEVRPSRPPVAPEATRVTSRPPVAPEARPSRPPVTPEGTRRTRTGEQAAVPARRRTGEHVLPEAATPLEQVNTTGKVGEFWMSARRRQAAVILAALLLAGFWLLLFLGPSLQSHPEEVSAPARRPPPRPMSSGGGGGGGGGGHGGGGGGGGGGAAEAAEEDPGGYPQNGVVPSHRMGVEVPANRLFRRPEHPETSRRTAH